MHFFVVIQENSIREAQLSIGVSRTYFSVFFNNIKIGSRKISFYLFKPKVQEVPQSQAAAARGREKA